MPKLEVLSGPQMEAICDILGDTSTGLTGSEIGRLLSDSNIPDIDSANTKRYRLKAALTQRQSMDGCSNNVINFIQNTMSPIRYTKSPDVFRERRNSLNVALALCGYTVREDGIVEAVKTASTLTEAERRADKLRKQLHERRVHSEVLRFCRAELVDGNYFHAVLEATKSIAERLRQETGRVDDGATLIDATFSVNRPLLAINRLTTDSEKSEQSGFGSLIKGIFGMFRNPHAHSPHISWPIEETEDLDLLTTVSMVHRKLDSAVKVPTGPP